MTGWLWLALAIALELTATTSLKASDGLRDRRFLPVVLLGYLGSFAALGLSLRTVPLGVAYAVWSGVGVAATALIGRFGFGEPLGRRSLLGLGLVVVGVAVLQLGAGT